MPELPEVQITVNGLNHTVKGRKILRVATTYNSKFFKNKDEIKNPKFFAKFKQKITGRKILKAERRAKNVLLYLTGGQTILVHMKMTGHFVYNRVVPFIRLDFTLDNGKHLFLSDMRKFAKVTLIETSLLSEFTHLKHLGPEPLERSFKFEVFKSQVLKKPKGKIKRVLMDPKIIAGIGNIYSDEILWYSNVHPLSRVSVIPDKNLHAMYKATRELLRKGVTLGGDSMSDYRNIHGEKGYFQEHHRAYQKHGTKCSKRGPRRGGARCQGILEKITIGARSAHFCPKHQKFYK
ncbi:MAG: bifunctional DNA-formamidopyrimidine glycosylase/DNA-(apurinic or apyrimidinic site) lyase [bacterium]